MKQKTGSRKGSAILWAVLVMLMLSLLAAGIVMVDRVYYMQEQEENYRCQAKFYAESAIELISDDIQKEGKAITNLDGTAGTYESNYVTAANTSKTYEVTFPDAPNWTCTITVNHSVVNLSEVDATGKTLSEEEKKKQARQSGEIYLTAKVTRKTTGGSPKELAEVCARIKCESEKWGEPVYYNL